MSTEKRRYYYRYVTEAKFTPAVEYHFFKLRAVPCVNEFQRLEEQSLLVLPSDCILNFSTDAFGNSIQYGSYNLWHDYFRVESKGIVECEKYAIPDPCPNDIYSSPSYLIQYDQELMDWAKQIAEYKQEGWSLPEILTHAVHHKIRYQKYETDNTTTAVEVFHKEKGVCQDYAHLLIAVCRCLGLHARYVNGFVLGEGETHAWVEIHDGKQWLGYDATPASSTSLLLIIPCFLS